MQPHANAPRVARVLIDSPLPQLDRLFDYAVPERLAERAVPGVRVRVPLRNRVSDGWLVELASSSEVAGSLSELDDVVSTIPVLSAPVVTLARRLADRVAGTASDVLRLAVPKRQVRVEQAVAQLRAAASESAADLAGSSPHPGSEQALPQVAGFPDLATGLRSGGRYALQAPPHPIATVDGGWLPAWAALLADAVAAVRAVGKDAVLAVPDQRDLDQLARALQLRLPDEPVARLDGAQKPAMRYRSYLDAHDGRTHIVIGSRHALLAPLPDLGLIVVWDDADPVLEEPLAPYLQARDTALIRQELSGAALLLAGHTRSADVQRLVEVGWLQEALPAKAYRPRVVLSERQPEDRPTGRLPAAAYGLLRDGLANGPVLVQVARPPGEPIPVPIPDAEVNLTPPPAPDVLRTAAELGKAFPKIRVVTSHGAAAIREVDARPAIVVATRGTEPFALGGYRAVLLLDGGRMLAREAMRVSEDCLRWWANAASLAAPGAPILLTGVDGPVADAFATWNFPAYAAQELRDRRELGFPPALRTVRLHGQKEAVADLYNALQRDYAARVLQPIRSDGPAAEVLLGFEYRYGGEVAAAVKAAMIRAATGRHRPVRRPGLPLKARFDEREPFLE